MTHVKTKKNNEEKKVKHYYRQSAHLGSAQIKNIRNFYDRKSIYISSEINYEEMFLLPGGASSK
ncbi:hypothetical protein DYQ05_07830 [Treponema pedis]|nr:hypothetical protein DYQ05_07830 [Treponema pedis]